MIPNIFKVLVDSSGMGGYVTWLSILALLIQAGVDFYNGDIESGSNKITAAIAAYGLGRKIEKSNSNS